VGKKVGGEAQGGGEKKETFPAEGTEELKGSALKKDGSSPGTAVGSLSTAETYGKIGKRLGPPVHTKNQKPG